MTPCYYIITNVRGGNSKSIPAFNTLTSEDFKDILSNYNSDNLDNLELTETDKDKLSEFLKEHIHHSSVKRLLGESSIINLPVLIKEVNDIIINSFSEEDLYKAIKNFFSKKKKDHYPKTDVPKSVKDLIKTLSITSSKLESRLFANMNSDVRILSETSINQEIENINNDIEELDEVFQPSQYFKKLNYFLNITNNYLGWKNANALIKISNDRLKEGSWNWDNRLVYSDTADKKHLFMGLFKRIASDISPEKFQEIFSEWNEVLKEDKYNDYKIDFETLNIKEFFLGSFKEDKKGVNLPQFDIILRLTDSKLNKIKKLMEDTLDKLFIEVANTLNREKNVKESTLNNYRNTIKDIFTKIYSNSVALSKQSERFLEEEKLSRLSQEFGDKLLEDAINEIYVLSDSVEGKNSLGKKFQIATTLNPTKNNKTVNTKTSDNIYEFLMTHLSINKDIIRMPGIGQKGKDKWPYWLITAVYIRDGNKALVKGKRRNSNGVIESTSYLFSEETPLTYRKYDTFSDTEINEISEWGKNSYPILLPSGITYEVAKNLLSPGDIIGNRIIKEIYPGYMILLDTTRNTEYPVSYKSIQKDIEQDEDPKNKTIVLSKKLFNLENSKKINSFVPDKSVKGTYGVLKDSKSIENLSEGDYFKLSDWDGFKKIFYADSENVWALQTNKGNIEKNIPEYRILKPYKRNLITSGIVSAFNYKEAFEIFKLPREHFGKFGQESTLSRYANISIAKEGDFVVYESSDNIYYGKVINVEKQLALFWSKNSKSWEKFSYASLDNVTFYSKNNRLDKNSKYSLLANNLNIQMLPLESGKKLKKMSYIVSKDVPEYIINQKMFGLLPGSAYTEIGSYIEESYLDKKLEGNINKTDNIIRLLGGNPEVHGLFVNTIGTNEYERNYKNSGLNQIQGIYNLPKEFINENMLFNGAYVSVYSGSTINPKIYVISKVDSENVYLREYYRNKSGEILLHEIKVPIDTFLDFSTDSKGYHKVNSLARYYLQGGNEKFGIITSEIKKYTKEEKSNLETFKQDRNNLQLHLTKFFNDLNIQVEVTNSDKEFSYGQKAKLSTSVNDSITAKLVIKEDLGKREDLVHEVLHLFLSALRFKSPETYMNMLNSIVEVSEMEGASLLDKEEAFIFNIQKNMNNLEDSFFDTNLDISSLLKGMVEAGVLINPNILPENMNTNILEILKTPLIDYLKLRKKNVIHPMANANLAQLTPTFMRWLEENNYTLNCN